jgi:hypothetical protein
LWAVSVAQSPASNFLAALRAGENGNNGEFEVSFDRRRGCIPPWRVARYGNQVFILI